MKIYAEELGGKNSISLNFYQTRQGHYLKPCEMSKEKVLSFITGFTPV